MKSHEAKRSCEQAQHTASLFDHLVGGEEELLRNGQAERLGGVQIDNEVVLRR
jgi:hypothetical protein